SVTDRLLAAGYPLAGDPSLGGFRSENITSGSETTSAQAVVNQWSGDALHLTTMISPDLTEIGAGVTVNGGRSYFVIDCAQPAIGGIPQTAGVPAAGGSTLIPGGVIIPVVVVTPNADGDVIHDVKAGQTLWQIAISYGTKIDEIKRLNNLFDNNIYPGTRLLVRKDVLMAATLPPESAMIEATTSPTGLSTLTVPTLPQTLASTPVSGVSSASSSGVMGIAVAIIALALLGGGMVAWLGKSNKQRNIG
ncbi:MAG: LysM peptidoglycan-binding domain-containing protein, partial [Chloroflexota bacterium]